MIHYHHVFGSSCFILERNTIELFMALHFVVHFKFWKKYMFRSHISYNFYHISHNFYHLLDFEFILISFVVRKPFGILLTHWGRVTHICVSKLTIIGSDDGLAPGRRQTIIWTDAGILLIGPLGTNFSENLIGIQTFLFKKMRLKMSSAKWRPFCLGLNVLRSFELSGL